MNAYDVVVNESHDDALRLTARVRVRRGNADRDIRKGYSGAVFWLWV